jgi:hypothetical protein
MRLLGVRNGGAQGRAASTHGCLLPGSGEVVGLNYPRPIP